MDALRDMSWMRLLYSIGPAERFKFGSFRALALIVPPTPAHHNERYRYRILFFEGLSSSPNVAVNLESDLLGSWLLTVQSGASRRVAASFDALPAYARFKELALPLAAGECGQESLPGTDGTASTDSPGRDILKA